MNELIEERLQEIEAEYEKPMWERLGKVLFVGIATLVVSMISESQYDGQIKRFKERKQNARTRDHV